MSHHLVREKEFEYWWDIEGKGCCPKEDEETYEFVKRLARVAWLNGAYKERHRGGR